MPLIGRTLIVVPALAVAFALAGCDKTVSTSSVEKAIAQKLGERGYPGVKVSCPSDLKAKKGATYTCTATLPNGKKVTGQIVMTDDNGHFNFHF